MSKIQKLYEFNESNDIRQQFVNVTSEDIINYIETNNDVKFKFDGRCLEIAFYKTDGKGDRVSYFLLGYDLKDKKFFSENCIDSQPKGYDTYEEMRSHVFDIEDRIINNGSTMPTI